MQMALLMLKSSPLDLLLGFYYQSLLKTGFLLPGVPKTVLHQGTSPR